MEKSFLGIRRDEFFVSSLENVARPMSGRETIYWQVARVSSHGFRRLCVRFAVVLCCVCWMCP